MDNICFVFPYRGIGGVSVVFVQMAEYIAKHYSYNVFLVDYKDGAMAKKYNHKLCKLIEYSDTFKVNIPSKSFLIFQAMTPWSVFPNLKIKDDSKVFFWALHFSNFLPLIPGIRKYMQSNKFIFKLLSKTIIYVWFDKSRKFLNYLLKNKAVCFMDYDCLNSSMDLLEIKSFKPSILPVPFSNSFKNKSKNVIFNPENKELEFIWIGRLVNFKYYTFQRAVERLSKYLKKNNTKAKFTIVGSGPFHKKTLLLEKKYKNINFIFIDKINSNNLDNFLNEGNFNIAFCMGTSALNCASLGIPTILLDISYGRVGLNYKFQWLHQRDGSTLGEKVTYLNYCKNTKSLDFCIDEYLENPKKVSLKSLHYVEKNHSLVSTANLMLKNLNSSNVYYKDLTKKEFMKKGLIYLLFKKIFGSKHNQP